MARLKKFVAYRKRERPYTRISKFRKKSFVRMRPVNRIVRYNMGNTKGEFTHIIALKTKSVLQIRDNALESARLASNRVFEKKIGTPNYHLLMKCFPHHILRENPLATGAGADRFSTGMKKSFGKPIGVAAQFDAGQTIFELKTTKQFLKHALDGFRRAATKLPCACQVVVNES